MNSHRRRNKMDEGNCSERLAIGVCFGNETMHMGNPGTLRQSKSRKIKIARPLAIETHIRKKREKNPRRGEQASAQRCKRKTVWK